MKIGIIYKFEKKFRVIYSIHSFTTKTETLVSLKLSHSYDREPAILQDILQFVIAPDVEKFSLIMRCLHILWIYFFGGRDICKCVCIYKCIHFCIYVCIQAYIYIYTYTYIYILYMCLFISIYL